MRIAEVMTRSVITAAPDTRVRVIAELMRDRNVGSIVLVAERRPVGIVTDRDLTVSALAAGSDGTEGAGAHASAPVVTVDAGADVSTAAETMIANAVRRLVVLDEGELAGIVTLDDIVARTGDHRLTHRLAQRVTTATAPDFYFHQRET